MACTTAVLTSATYQPHEEGVGGNMQTALFENWLLVRTGLSVRAIRSYVSNCKRLERYEGDLDAHFDSDGMASLLARLSYSTFDERRGVWPRHSVPISGDLRNGTATLKSSATLYRDFLQRQRRADTVGIRQPKMASNEARQAHRNVRKYLILPIHKKDRSPKAVVGSQRTGHHGTQRKTSDSGSRELGCRCAFRRQPRRLGESRSTD